MAMRSRDIHIARDEEELGRFTTEEVTELLVAGFFRSSDRYWMPGMIDWLPIGEVFSPAKEKAVPALAALHRRLGETSASLAANVSRVVKHVKVGATQTGQAVSKTKERLLEKQLPAFQKLLADQLKDKPLAAAKSALHNEEVMRKAFGALYDCLPKPVCRFISEDAFIRFCLEHRERLLKSPTPAEQQGMRPDDSPTRKPEADGSSS
jgi:hypothetical protein